MWIAPYPLLLMLSGMIASPQTASPSPPVTSAPSAEPAPALPAEFDAAHQQAIDFDRSNRMTVPVRINNHPALSFLVDTGSERTVVSEELATRLALPRDGDVMISGVAGVSLATTAHVAELGFTNISVNDLIAPVLKERNLGADGLIGIDSLQNKLVVFDFDRQQMEIRKSRVRARPTSVDADEIIVTARTRAGRMIVTDAEIDGVKVTVVIDSGSQYSIGNPALLARLVAKRKKMGPMTPTTLYSVTGQAIAAEVSKVRRLLVGKMEMQDVPIAFANSPAFRTLKLDKKPALLMGINSLRAFRRVEVDFANRRVTFTIPDSVGLELDRRYAGRCSPAPSTQCGQATPAS